MRRHGAKAFVAARCVPALLLLLLLAAGSARAQEECTGEQQQEAVDAAADFAAEVQPGDKGKPQAPRLLALFKQHQRCDASGAVADALSDALCRLLGEAFKREAPELARTLRKDKPLQERVLAHVDASCRPEDLASIRDGAERRCPRYAKEFCQALAQRAVAAQDDAP